MIAKVETRSFFQTLMPEFMPQNRNSDKIMTDKICLFDKFGTMLPHAFHNIAGRLRATGDIRFHCHCQWIHQSLRMGFSNLSKQPVYSTPDPDVGLVDSSDQLRSDREPSVNVHGGECFCDNIVYFMISAMRKPQSKQSQSILQ